MTATRPILAAVIAMLPSALSSAAVLPACGSTPHPPHIIVLPDGSEVPAAGLVYQIDARRWIVQPYERIHCGGFEPTEAP